MKLLFLLCSVFIILAGCANDQQVNESHAEENAGGEKAEETTKEKVKYVNNPQASDDRNLDNPGEINEDTDGVLELKTISKDNEKFKVGPMEMEIEHVKVLNYSPSPDLIDFFHAYTHEETNFDYVKLRVSITNTSDKVTDFAPVSVLKTGQGEEKDFEDDFYLENLYGKYEPGEEKVGDLGFVLEKTDTEKLKDLTITTSDAFDAEGNSLEEAESITINF
ncbi:DUF4352 domain-containing protein [Halobacillus sp. Marseille-Q1614]|uniref:DUF4352 domain-containing protein n=1 Tax=Halobacillus sp. Marseille-Q1614 TaxID=2709134 RepID=UPI00157014E9|nr:DUF4352 domain-containing protein [Halobacillus sp. Marseille-Q1614]